MHQTIDTKLGGQKSPCLCRASILLFQSLVREAPEGKQVWLFPPPLLRPGRCPLDLVKAADDSVWKAGDVKSRVTGVWPLDASFHVSKETWIMQGSLEGGGPVPVVCVRKGARIKRQVVAEVKTKESLAIR